MECYFVALSFKRWLGGAVHSTNGESGAINTAASRNLHHSSLRLFHQPSPFICPRIPILLWNGGLKGRCRPLALHAPRRITSFRRLFPVWPPKLPPTATCNSACSTRVQTLEGFLQIFLVMRRQPSRLSDPSALQQGQCGVLSAGGVSESLKFKTPFSHGGITSTPDGEPAG